MGGEERLRAAAVESEHLEALVSRRLESRRVVDMAGVAGHMVLHVAG
jgi:hypothetical protein